MRPGGFVVVFVLVNGCGEDSVDALVEPEAPPPHPITLSATNPVVAGARFQVDVENAPPNSSVTVLRSYGHLGAGGCPPALGGSCLDITPGPTGYHVMATIRTDPQGRGSYSAVVPAAAPTGGYVAFQAVDPASGELSNPLLRAMTTRGTCWADVLEENDDCTHARRLPTGPLQALTVCQNDAFDWYQVDLVAGETLEIDLQYNPANADVDLVLVDPAQFWPVPNDLGTIVLAGVAMAVSPLGVDHLQFTAPADGTWYLAATALQIRRPGEYTMRVQRY